MGHLRTTVESKLDLVEAHHMERCMELARTICWKLRDLRSVAAKLCFAFVLISEPLIHPKRLSGTQRGDVDDWELQ